MCVIFFFQINCIKIVLVIPKKKILKNTIIRHPEITEHDKWSWAALILKTERACARNVLNLNTQNRQILPQQIYSRF